MTGCQGEKTVEVETAGEWHRWTLAKAGAFGGYTDLIHVKAILPRTAREPWTAVGQTVDLGGTRHPKLWTSSDGASWEVEAIPTDERFDRMAFATRHGRSLVVVGIRGEQGELGAFASRRDAAGRWSRTSDGIGLLPRVGGISPGPGGLVVVGARAEEGEVGLARSADGSRWTATFEPTLTAGAAGDAIDAWGYAVSRTTEVVVGMTASPASSPNPQYEPRVWWSSAGRRWNRASVPPNVHFLNDVVTFRGGFVATGESTSSQPVAGVSADGRAWTWLEMEPGYGYAAALELVVVGEKLVAVGVTNPHEDLAVWSSPDGRRWSPVLLPEELKAFPFSWVDAAGGPDGELAIALHDQDESEVYIGRP